MPVVGKTGSTPNLPTRNNNPLNVKVGDATKHWLGQGASVGDAAQDGGNFLHFDSPEHGYQAARDLLFGGHYSGLTVDQAMRQWSNKGYGAEVAGLAPGTRMSELSPDQQQALVSAMAVREGFHGESPNVQSTVQSAAATPDAPLRSIYSDDLNPPKSTSIYSDGPDPLNQAAQAAAGQTPDRAARILQMQTKTGMPVGVIDRNLDELEKQSAGADFDADQFRAKSPLLAQWLLANPEHFALAKDDLPQLSLLEQTLDVGRSLVAGAVSGVGQAIQGVGATLDVAKRFQAAHPILLPPEAALLGALPEGQSFSGITEKASAPIEAAGKAIAPPPERQNFGTEVASGLGQLIPAVGLGIVAPETVPLLFGFQGAAQMDERAKALGKQGTPDADIAITAGFGVNALIGELGIEKLLERVPPQIRNVFIQKLADVAISGGYQAAQQVAMELANNVALRLTIQPNAPLSADLTREALAGGATGMIARAILGHALPHLSGELERAHAAKQSTDFFKALGEGVTHSKTFERLPAKLQEFVTKATKDGPIENVYLPAEEARQYFQEQKLDPQDILGPDGARQLQDALDSGADVKVPMAEYATRIAPTEHAQFFNEIARLGSPEAMNAREAEAFAKQQESAAKEPPSAEEPSPEVQASAARVREDVTGQLLGQGFERSAVDAYAQMYETAFRTMGQRSNQDPFALYQHYGLTVNRPIPEILRALPNLDTHLDTMIDRLRSGDAPKQSEMFGQSLVEFLQQHGGVQDDGGDLASREPDKGRKPFEKNLLQPKTGMPLDRARELAAEAGYIGGDSSTSDFLDKIDQELRGQPVYAQGQENPQAIEQGQVLQDLGQYLESRDINVKTATNDEIKKVLNQAAGEAIDPVTGEINYHQAAFHGSPHVFDKFSLQKIGSGEGAQAYGWGLYFASQKEIAEHYRRALTSNSDVTLDGKPLESVEDPNQRLALRTVEGNRSIENAIGELRRIAEAVPDGRKPSFDERASKRNHARAADWLEANKDRIEIKPAGRLYQVEIPENADYLDYDKPLSEQSDKAKAAVEALRKQFRSVAALGDNPTGADLYKRLSALRGEQGASELLASKGLAGIKYLDNSSRIQQRIRRYGETPSEETHNYVVFDDNLVHITGYEQQSATGEARGQIRFGPNRQVQIDLLQKADLSSFLHETGHFYLEVFGDLTDQLKQSGDLNPLQQRMVEDYGKALKFLGVESRDQISTEQHEQWARAFEAYLREGKAPSPELRSMFQRFRDWLTNIYRSLTQLHVELTPEVRGVMDRLLATDEEITRAEDDAKVEGLFENSEIAKDLGISDKELKLYTDDVRKARDGAKDQLQRAFMDESNQRQKDWYQARRNEVETQVASEVHQQKDQIARSFLKDGTLPDGSPLPEGIEGVKLDAKALDERYGKASSKPGKGSTITNKLLELDVYRRQGGVSPDDAADLLGYSSGDELVQALVNTRDPKALIAAETDSRMKDQYGDMLTDGTASEKARDAVMTVGRSDILVAEMKALAKKQREVAPFINFGKQQERQAGQARQAQGIDSFQRFVPTVGAVRAIAERRTSAMAVRDLKPGTYWAAARRESKAGMEAALGQKFDQALASKQRELLAVEMYRATTNAKAQAEKSVEYLRSFDDAKKRERIGKAGSDYLEQIDALRERFDFTKQTLKAIDQRKSLLQFVQAQEAEGHPLDIAPELLNDARRQNYKDLTVEQLNGLTDAVQSIEHWARFKNKLLANQAKRDLNELGADGVASIDGNSKGPRQTKIEPRLPGQQGARTVQNYLLGHLPLGSILREMDGFQDGGFLHENVMRRLDEAGSDEASRLEKAAEAVSQIYQDAYGGQESSLYETQFLPEIQNSLSKMARLVTALNWGNETSRQRVRDGGIGGTGKLTDPQVKAILDTLDQRDWTFVQSIWDHVNSYWSDIARMHKTVTGVAPEKVEAVPVQTKFGEMPGGYFPLAYEGRISMRAAANPEASFAKSIEQASYARAMTMHGYTETRVEGKVTLPLRADFGVIGEHLQEIIHDLTHREALIDVGRLLGRKDIQEAVVRNYGDITYQEVKGHIRDIAIGRTPAPQWYRAYASIRGKAVQARLGWNAVTALMHVTNITSGMARVDAVSVAKGLGKWFGSARDAENSASGIAAQSEVMRLRWKHRMVELDEVRDQIGLDRGKWSAAVHDAAAKVGITGEVTRGLADSYLYAIHRIIQFAEIPTWIAANEKALASGRELSDARSMADRAVLDAFGGGQIKDLARVQQEPLGKVFSTFMTYQLSAHRQLRELVKKDASLGRKLVDATMLLAVPIALAATVHHVAARKEDKEGLPRELAGETVDHALGMFVFARELTGLVSSGEYSGPAATGIFGVLKRFAHQASAGEFTSGTLKAGNEAAGELLGFPAHQVDRTVEGILALWEGRTHNPAALLFGPSK